MSPRKKAPLSGMQISSADPSNDEPISAADVRYRVRAGDPVTSVLAAERSMEFSGGQRARIMEALRSLGSATAQELASATGLTVVQVDRRLPEAKRDGTAEVMQLNGDDVRRDGYRVWMPVKNFSIKSN